MKNIFKTSFLALFVSVIGIHHAQAQGNLQFNQIIHYVLLGGTAQNITIPSGKVWKIEAVSDPELFSTVQLRNPANQRIAVFPYSSSYHQNLPYWLPSGFTGNFYYGYVGFRASVSIIEFNVIP